MVLGDSDIIQIDATVIVGVLIFLTVGTDTLLGGNEFENESIDAVYEFIILTLVMLMIIPFSISATSMINASRTELFQGSIDTKTKRKHQIMALRLMFFGFVYITIGIVVIIMIRVASSSSIIS